MKTLLLVALVLSSKISHAAFLDDVCSKALMDDPTRPHSSISNSPSFSEDLVSRRIIDDQGLRFVIENLEGKNLYTTNERIASVLKQGTTTWVLTSFELLELNEHFQVKARATIESDPTPASENLSFVNSGNMLVISRGSAGLVGFDLTSKSIKWKVPVTDADGWPSGLAASDKVVYAASESAREKGFTGILTVDPLTGNILRHSAYDTYRWGVIGQDVKARMHNGNLILNNGGWIHLLTPKQLTSTKTLSPRWVALMIPQQGEVNAHYMMLNGDFFFEGDELMGCGDFTTKESDQYVRRSRLFRVKMP